MFFTDLYQPLHSLAADWHQLGANFVCLLFGFAQVVHSWLIESVSYTVLGDAAEVDGMIDNERKQ